MCCQFDLGASRVDRFLTVWGRTTKADGGAIFVSLHGLSFGSLMDVE